MGVLFRSVCTGGDSAAATDDDESNNEDTTSEENHVVQCGLNRFMTSLLRA
jgi:hypothetical protein